MDRGARRATVHEVAESDTTERLTLDLCITLMAESEEELKAFLMKVKEESEKVGLKLNIQIF